MDGSVAGQRTGWPQGVAEPVFDLVAAKLLRPLVRPGTVGRTALIDRLRDDARPIVSVVAPAGYGKTTLLSQWAERNDQRFAWVSVDEADNDPKVLLTYVAEALNAVEPIGRQVFAALASPASSVPGSVVPRLGAAFSSMNSPVTLVLDDVHLLRNSECRAALSVLADHVPAGSRLVLAGRAEPPLRIARLRAEGRITEIGPADLSLTAAEAAALLRAAEVMLGEDDVAELHRRTEGWPVGLYLAALYLREGGSLPGAVASFGGDDLFVSQYVESEFLERISSTQRVFLTRTAVLERMSGPLCEAVLGVPGSGAILADLAGSNLLLVPLDRRGQWYRYHHLFRDMLLAELERLEPGLFPVLRRRAADWCLRAGLAEEALEYLMAAEAVDEAARVAGELWLPIYRQGRIATLERWFRWLEEHDGLDPMATVAAALTAAQTGRSVEAERWADAVDHWQYGSPAGSGDPAAEAWAAVLRALMCRRGVEQMRADADEAARLLTAAGIVAPAAPALQGLARLLGGDVDGAEAYLEEGVRIGEVGATDTLTALLCELCLLAMARDQWDEAGKLAAEARAVLLRAEAEDPFANAVAARVAMHRGDVATARRELVAAQRLRPLLTYATPHLAVQVRIELVRVHLALSDLAGARTLMGEIDEILRRRPDLGTLVAEVKALRARLGREHGPSVPGASALTAAELRLLPMLATHLSVPEIAAELFLSPHTIKSQMKSIYRKLDSTSRTQTITRARELGLLEG
jgi:LuxR family transcriptional regulator, maltose regulon positive regulatory protein